jgi:hypothetical protein
MNLKNKIITWILVALIFLPFILFFTNLMHKFPFLGAVFCISLPLSGVAFYALFMRERGWRV